MSGSWALSKEEVALMAAELVWEVSRHYLVINELVPADSMLL